MDYLIILDDFLACWQTFVLCVCTSRLIHVSYSAFRQSQQRDGLFLVHFIQHLN